MIRGIVFADPLSANDNIYKMVFQTVEEQRIDIILTKKYGIVYL